MSPTSFLSLSREIRPKIKTDSFDDVPEQDITFNRYLRLFDFIVCAHGPPTAPHTHAWATTLSLVHPVISDDLPFVLQQHLRHIEGHISELWKHPPPLVEYHATEIRWWALTTPMTKAYQQVPEMIKALGRNEDPGSLSLGSKGFSDVSMLQCGARDVERTKVSVLGILNNRGILSTASLT